jgi:uncharacterized protein YciI
VYVLVVLQDGSNADAEALHATAHEEFISALIKRNAVLLGGALADVVDKAHSAYVLRCKHMAEAERLAAEDPFAVNDVVRPKCVEWQLVGVNPDAIDAADVVRAADV